MTSVVIPVKPFDLVIFGATGDLAMRKLLPALFRRHAVAQIPEDARIIGLSLSNHSNEKYRSLAREALVKHISEEELEGHLDSFIERIHYMPNDVTNPEGWTELVETLNEKPDRIRVYYLAVGPSLFGVIAHGLAAAGLSGGGARLVVEKPLGHDLKSAQQLNADIGEVFDEHCIYRIDHYLGKETVQNLMAMRFANALFEPIWNAQAIDHVQITAAESLGVGTRGGYYDHSGAMRDMVQNHLMQLLCLIAMEPPHDFNADAVRDEKLKVLRALRPLKGHTALRNTVRGQYLGTETAPSYTDEVKNPDSTTECYVAIKAEVENWRWAGVPFYLRTGKKLRSQATEIAIVFKKPPHSVFGELSTPVTPNVLSIRLQPDEGLQLELMTKDPGPGGFRLRSTPLDVTFAKDQAKGWRMPDAYERLLMDVVRGDQTLFMRGDEVEAAWSWIDPIMESWDDSGLKPETYDAGSEGPTAAVEMMARAGRRWRKI
ncbi:glucose-6-phosphate dehydrogenase [Leucothrix mucor]|uniref:glucose-6-phosphate dehydrogenase n=1 Tax=Leucothrix mucor TaxID=45248 RepID=UPI0003B51D35|nr:glucose-6-phosphate dehydrogenase [Leucothrix mucor]